MSGFAAVGVTACACTVIAALLSHFVTGGTKRLIYLVMGAFLVCSMLAPVSRAIKGIGAGISASEQQEQESGRAQDGFRAQVLEQTKQNLEAALADILAQNGISISRAEAQLALEDENRVIISAITVTVSAENAADKAEIERITELHFGVKPQVVTE